MSKLSTERAIDALDTVRAYYASLTVGYPKGKDCKGIGDVTCVEIANSCLMAIKALRQEQKTDEIILSKKEYRELLSDEFEHGYDKGLSDAITSLEQEPCNDAISRQAVKDMLDARGVKAVMTFEHFKELLDKLPSVTPTHKEWIPVPEGATNKDMFKTVFGYEPATDAVVCNKEDWCGASKPCNYCFGNPNTIGREEEWWNAPYKAEREGKE